MGSIAVAKSLLVITISPPHFRAFIPYSSGGSECSPIMLPRLLTVKASLIGVVKVSELGIENMSASATAHTRTLAGTAGPSTANAADKAGTAMMPDPVLEFLRIRDK
jgi:hypothetical protein